MEGYKENIVTPKMAKMIDQLSKEPLEDIEKNLEKLLESAANDMAARLEEAEKRVVPIYIDGKLEMVEWE